MKYRYFFLVSLILLISSHVSRAQLVGDNVFLQGRFLEVCVAPNGSWGNTVTPPAGYHTHTGGSTSGYSDPGTGTSYSGSSTMDFQYNPEHGGWGVAGTGGFALYGPYFLPGTPFDGWSMQVNGVKSDAYYTTAGFTGGTLTGNNVSYTYSGGTMIGTWTGSAGVSSALKITTTNRVDTMASWDVVTIKFVNTSAATMPGLYYFVTADPDNDEPCPGSFPTNNHIYYQNDYRHRVMVEARPPSAHQDAYSSLCTRDCRAKAIIYVSWPPAYSTSNYLDLVWAGTATGMSTCYYGLNDWTWSQDIAYGLIYNLGDLAAGDSTILSFAWNFKDSTCTDSAFPDPVLVVNGTQVPNGDTILACSLAGMSSVPVNIKYGDDKVWSLGHWTWSPAIGLTSTTGVTNSVNFGALAGPQTYTVTGDDSVSGIHSCNNYVLYFTVIPCFGATNNGPLCPGDMLHLDATGDSVGATYQWYNAGGTLVSTNHHAVIGPVTYADSGTYTVVRIMGGASDTARTHVVIWWKPTLTLTSNAPLCYGMVDTLTLSAAPDSVGETFVWTGPAGFTSTLVSPVINGFTSLDSGIYTVIATSNHGCKDTAHIDATMLSQPPTPVISGITTYCSGDVFVPLTVTGYTGTLYWYNTAVGGVGSTTAPTVNTSYGGTYTFWVTQKIGACESLRGSFTVQVIVTPAPPTITGTTTYCQYDTYIPPTAAGTNILWYITPTGGVGSTMVPTVNTAVPGVTTIYATQMDSGCTSARGPFTITVNPKPLPPAISGITVYCQNDVPTPFTVTGVTGTLLWYTAATGGVGSTTPTPINTTTPGVTTYWVAQTNGFCISDRVSITVTVHPTPVAPVITGTSVYCQFVPYIPPTATPTGTGVIQWYTAIGGVPMSSPPAISTLIPGIVTIYATQIDSGCISAVDSFVITINPKPNPPIITDSPDHYCPGQAFVPFTIVYGTGIQWFTSPTGGVGSGVAPVMSTVHPGTQTVWASQTVTGCESDRTPVSILVYDSVIAGFTDAIKLGCGADTVSFTNQSTGATVYAWNFGDNYTSPDANPTHLYYTQGTFTVTLIARSATCVDSTKTTILLNNPISAGITVVPRDTVCQGDAVTFVGSTVAISPKYLWNFGDGGRDSVSSPFHIYPNMGTYTVTLTVTDFVPCEAVATHVIVVDTISPIKMLISDTVFCQGTFATFDGVFSTIGDTQIIWNFGDNNNDGTTGMNPVKHAYANPDSFTVTLTVDYRACPVESVSRKVKILPKPRVNLGNDTSICPGGQPLILTNLIGVPAGDVSYLWNTGQTSSSIAISAPGMYKLTETVNGCYNSDSIYVEKDCYMNLPNIFSPNGDGVNDYFYPRQLLTKGLTQFKMDIFNRWGELIFESTSLDGRGWDGTFNGVMQPEGVYIYVVDATFKDGQKEHHQGNITLLK